jgi:glycosyltransferase involved in cell wall biosynthesis
MRNIVWNLLVLLMAPLFLLAAILPSRRRNRLIWGASPLISNKYWSEAMKEGGWDSVTIMEGFFSINRREDYDLYFEDFAPAWLPRKIRMGLGNCFALAYLLRRGRVAHLTFDGFVLGRTWFWRFEGALLKLAKIKIIVMPYGADNFAYSRVMDLSTRYGLLASYPQFALKDELVRARLSYWTRQADAVVAGFLIDGLPRWDVTMPQMFSIDTRQWTPISSYSQADGRNAAVRVLHTPNHRGFKGTEFLVAAVEKLRAEGLLIDLVLLEKVPNEEVRRVMGTVDIMAEQLIYSCYALSGIEGMACGLAVMTNLASEPHTRVYRRYAFLDECPILSTTPENVLDNLRLLVTRPDLRETLGRAGRAYVEKYHSYEAARFLFESIYAKLLDGKDVDLMNLYHPLKSEHARTHPRIRHPLIDNLYPAVDAPPC